MLHSEHVITSSIISTVIEQLRHLPQSKRLIVGVSGPQGSGKTTVSQQAAQQLSTIHNIPTLTLSLDDFYKPYADLTELSRKGNPLLKYRGLPGTHDTDLLNQFCNNFLHTCNTLEVPVYDKSLHDGAGDRLKFREVSGDIKAVILEGWMLGFTPVSSSVISSKMNLMNDLAFKPTQQNLEEINNNLAAYCCVWNTVDFWFRLVPKDLNFVYIWRLQQEHDLIRSTGQGMTDEQVHTFVDQYMPCYELYSNDMGKLQNCKVFLLDESHNATKLTSV